VGVMNVTLTVLGRGRCDGRESRIRPPGRITLT
jgi:hypothetical protein